MLTCEGHGVGVGVGRFNSVRVRLGRRDWTPAVVTDLQSAPCSYLVTTENGRVYRRNRRVINPSAEPPPVVWAAQKETPAFPSVPCSQTSTPVQPVQPDRKRHHSNHLYLTLRCKKLLLEFVLVWGDNHCGWLFHSMILTLWVWTTITNCLTLLLLLLIILLDFYTGWCMI